MGSSRYPGRRSLKGWQLTAVVGAAGAMALAGCGSSGSSSSSAAGGATQSASGSATSGSIVWSASPIAGSGANDTRTVLINSFEKKYPNIHVTLVSAPTNTDTNRATLATEISGGSATPDVFMGDVIWPAQFGAHQLAVPLSDYLPQSYFAQFAPGLVAGRQLQGQGLRLAAVRGPGFHVLPQGPAGQGRAAASDDLGAAGKRRQDPGEQAPSQVRLRLAGRLV